MNLNKIEKDLVSEIKLSQIQAKVFLLVVTQGKMTAKKIAKSLGIFTKEALEAANEIVKLGGFIDISDTEFEAMHPRFTAVNMYRKMCERENIEFKKNNTVDNIGVALEEAYDAARTK